ncbi:MAG: hypothetical protein JWM47_2024 [Acidimicrobiales bacterium]|nr:hypothetical protein [Acidimicrobiales bacterium]
MALPCDTFDPVLPASAFALVALVSYAVGQVRGRSLRSSRRLALAAMGCLLSGTLLGTNLPGGCVRSPDNAAPIKPDEVALRAVPGSEPLRLRAQGFEPETLLRLVICTAPLPRSIRDGVDNGNDVVRFASKNCDLTADRTALTDTAGRVTVDGTAPEVVQVVDRTVDCRRQPCYLVVAQDQPGNEAFATAPVVPG